MTPALAPLRTDRVSVLLRPEILVLLLPALAKLLLHLFAINGYGIHGDELYYIACSDHMDWGYVDHPPLSIFILHLQRLISGDSLLYIRLLPALAGSCTVVLTGLLARRMGAQLFGQLLAGICALVAPAYLAVDHFYSMNAFDILFWLIAVYLMIAILDGGKPTLWLWLGLVMGLGLQNKISVLFLGFGIVVGLLMTKQRRLFLSPWPWLGALIAIALMIPNILWQMNHGWPTPEWIGNARANKMVALSFPAYLSQQLILMQPLTVFVWGTGLCFLLLHSAVDRYRSLGWCYLAVLAVFVVQGGKPYYLIPMYPVLFAAGGIAFERWLTKKWTKVAVALILLGFGAMTAPLGMPLLPVENFISYSTALGLHASSGERHAEGRLPDLFANMFGWQKLTALVDSVYRGLPTEDQARCGIFCQNYMQAGAIDFYGRHYHLPAAISGHNNYWLWGPRGYSGDVMIVLGSSEATLQKYFDEVTESARFHDEYVQPGLKGLRIFVVRKPKASVTMMWPGIKVYD